MKVINTLLIFLMLTSCSRLLLVNDSNQKITNASPISLTKNQFKFEVETETLLWGIMPKDYSLSLKDGMELLKFNKVGKVSTKIFQTKTQKLLTILSLGIYIPETIEYTFWGELFIDE